MGCFVSAVCDRCYIVWFRLKSQKFLSPSASNNNITTTITSPASYHHRTRLSVWSADMCTSSTRKNPELSTATGHSHVRKTSILKRSQSTNTTSSSSTSSDFKKVWFDTVEVRSLAFSKSKVLGMSSNSHRLGSWMLPVIAGSALLTTTGFFLVAIRSCCVISRCNMTRQLGEVP